MAISSGFILTIKNTHCVNTGLEIASLAQEFNLYIYIHRERGRFKYLETASHKQEHFGFCGI